MQIQLEIILTADGSQTIRDNTLDTTYHSTNGAVTESMHVFVEAGLKHVIAKGVSKIRILEMGFGTGLNAFLSYLETRNSLLEVEYFGIEANPLPHSIVDELVYSKFLDVGPEDKIFRKMHIASSWTEKHFTFEILHGNIEDLELPMGNVLIFYDAFGPADQSEMWNLDILGKIVRSMAPGGVLVTYCAQGQFKRNLKKLGCVVESLPGPPGKREMIRATL